MAKEDEVKKNAEEILKHELRLNALEQRMSTVETQAEQIPEIAILVARIEEKLDTRYEMTEAYRKEREEMEARAREQALEEQRRQDDQAIEKARHLSNRDFDNEHRNKDRRVQWIMVIVTLMGLGFGADLIIDIIRSIGG